MTLTLLTAGESHGLAIIAILEGIPAGLPLDTAIIDRQLARRQRGYGAGPRMRIEQDRAIILSGVLAGQTTGAPIAIQVANRDHSKWRGKAIPPFTTPRPGHADLSATLKYGYSDLRPALERASARETAGRVAAGAICIHFLAQFDIQVGGYVRSIGEINANADALPYSERIAQAETNDLRCPDAVVYMAMRNAVENTIHAKNTLGGVIEVAALGLPPGLGSHVHWERRLDARLGAAMLSIQAIKGVEIGPAFENARLTGTQAHDSIVLDSESSQLARPTNRAGGLEGGITNGQALVVRLAMKPIASTLTPQPTVDLHTGQNTQTEYQRSDFCPVPRAVPVAESMAAFVLADALIEKLGGDSLKEMLPRFANLPTCRLEDTHLDGQRHDFWPDEE